jgi:hypothetical protein
MVAMVGASGGAGRGGACFRIGLGTVVCPSSQT